MNTVPQYWKTSLAAVDDAVKEIKRGRVEITAYSAGKRPIYKIEYGESGVVHGRANLSSALGARDIKYFADKSGEDYKPTLFLVGCMHGGEFEGVSAILNLIKLMETGTDYAGREERSLVSLM